MADELLQDEELVEKEINPLVEEIKTRLAITGNHHDSLLLAYANDTKEYLLSAGVPLAVLESERSIGIIARGVSDMWNGEGKFSEMFYQRAIQLTAEVVEDVQT